MGSLRGKETEQKILVSVVVPVYNAQRYLREMIRTVVGQTLRETEIIFVSDGSEDDSCRIIRGFQKKDRRIRLISQEHKNAGAARNRGLSEARGKYVVFWDADDTFDRRALSLMAQRMERTGADICICGVSERMADGRIYGTDHLRKSRLPARDPFNKFDCSEVFFEIGSNSPWNKMFRRAFLTEKNLRFQEIVQANDTSFVMQAMFHAASITHVDRNLVCYRAFSEESLTAKSSQTAFCPYESYLHALRALEKEPYFQLVRSSFLSKAARGILRSLNCQTSFAAYEELYEFLRDEGIKTLGLDACRREEFDEDWICEDLERMRTMPAGDFLLLKDSERRADRDQLKYTLRRVRKKLAPLLWLNDRQKALRRRVREGFQG